MFLMARTIRIRFDVSQDRERYSGAAGYFAETEKTHSRRQRVDLIVCK